MIEQQSSLTLVERILGHPATLRPSDVRRAAGASKETSEGFWHALGFPIAEHDDVMFTDADVVALRAALALVRDGRLDDAVALGMTRAFARTSDRLAVWLTQLMAESLMWPEDDEEDPTLSPQERAAFERSVAQAAAEQLADLADDLEPLFVYAWRRHLLAAMERMQADIDPDHEVTAGAPTRAVGFADLVSFTALSRRMTERQLSLLVQRFEALATDIVTAHGGRVIKTVGDEVLWVHTEAPAGAAIALDLVEALSEEPVLPDVRVGMAYGAVVSRLGDIFGTTVNRASRLTSAAPPAHVYIDEALARRLDASSGFTMRRQRRRNLRGIGGVVPSDLTRATGARTLEETS